MQEEGDGVKKYEVKLTVTTSDVLDNMSEGDFATSLKEDIQYETYGQIKVEHAEAKEVAE